jgi:hypothetical protein
MGHEIKINKEENGPDLGTEMDRQDSNHATTAHDDFFFFFLWDYWHCGHSWHIVPASGDSEDDCGEADGM